METRFHRTFRKKLQKLPQSIQASFERRLTLFCYEAFNAELRNHKLTGSWNGYRSIDITGDIRAIYFPIDAENALFVEIGTHHELYGS